MSGKSVIIAAVLIFSATVATPALADSHWKKIRAYIDSDIIGWLSASEIVDAVDQQNIDHMGLDPVAIRTLNRRWRKERLRGGGPLIRSKMDNSLSAFLRGVRAASGEAISDILVVDKRGLNAGQTNDTDTFFQGDKEAWQKTYPVSAAAIFIDLIEERGGVRIVQTSLTLARGNGARLGAVIIDINVDALD